MARIPARPRRRPAPTEKAAERDKSFPAHEARDFGLIDEVFEKRPAPADEEAAVRAA